MRVNKMKKLNDSQNRDSMFVKLTQENNDVIYINISAICMINPQSRLVYASSGVGYDILVLQEQSFRELIEIIEG